jgi:hypothetical protein
VPRALLVIVFVVRKKKDDGDDEQPFNPEAILRDHDLA